MINQVGSNYPNKDVFSLLPKNSTPFAIVKPITQTQNDEFKKEKEQKTNVFGYSIAILASLVGFGLFAGRKVFSAKHGLKAKELTKNLGDSIDKAGAKGIFTKIKYMGREVKNKFQVVFNIATFKDILFVKGLKKVSFLKRFHEYVTGAFERVSVKTSKKAYDKSLVAFDSLYAKFADANNSLRGKVSSEQIGTIEQKIKNINANYTLGFSETARNERLARTQEELKNFDEEIWKQTYGSLRTFLKKAKEGKFVAEHEAQKTKDALRDVVNGFKEKITLSATDSSKTVKSLFHNVDAHLDVRDKQSERLLGELRQHFTVYRNSLGSTADKAVIENNKATLEKTLDALSNYVAKPNSFYKKEKADDIIQAASDLKNVLRTNKTGEIQEVMDFYKQHLSTEDYAKLQKTVDKTLKKFDKATNLESDKLFDKIRDLKLGSASHDVLLGLLAPLGIITWGVSKAENKDEKISVTLKYGIPALFGMATAIACTVGLVSSGPSLLIGLASTIPINMLGKAIDNMRKNQNNEYAQEHAPAKMLPGLNLASPMQLIRNIENNKKTV